MSFQQEIKKGENLEVTYKCGNCGRIFKDYSREKRTEKYLNLENKQIIVFVCECENCFNNCYGDFYLKNWFDDNKLKKEIIDIKNLENEKMGAFLEKEIVDLREKK